MDKIHDANHSQVVPPNYIKPYEFTSYVVISPNDGFSGQTTWFKMRDEDRNDGITMKHNLVESIRQRTQSTEECRKISGAVKFAPVLEAFVKKRSAIFRFQSHRSNTMNHIDIDRFDPIQKRLELIRLEWIKR